jgi:hypothetical protein
MWEHSMALVDVAQQPEVLRTLDEPPHPSPTVPLQLFRCRANGAVHASTARVGTGMSVRFEGRLGPALGSGGDKGSRGAGS